MVTARGRVEVNARARVGGLRALLGGASAAQVLSILAAPLLTRLYSPVELGIYTLAITAVALFGPALCLKYDMVLVISQDPDESRDLVWLSLCLGFFLSALIAPFFSFWVLAPHLQNGALWATGSVIFALLMLQVLWNVGTAVLGFDGRFSRIASATVARSLVSNSSFIAMGGLGAGIAGLLGGQFAGVAVAALVVTCGLGSNLVGGSTIGRMQRAASRYGRQALFNAPAALMATAAFGTVALFIAYAYSAEAVGYYSLGYRLLGIPLVVLSGSVSRVFFRSFASAVDRGDGVRLYGQAAMVLALIVTPSFFIVALFAPSAFSWAFGARWEQAGTYVAILCPLFAVRVVVDALSTAFVVLEAQWLEFVGLAVLLLVQSAVFVHALRSQMGVTTFLFTLSGAYVAVYVGIFIAMSVLVVRRCRSR